MDEQTYQNEINRADTIPDEELLSCPFCGKEPYIDYCEVECCGGQPRMIDCKCGASLWVNARTDLDAIKQWNTRCNDQLLLDTLENLVDAVTEATEDTRGIFTIAYVHGVEYKGRQYGNELNEARRILELYKGI